ncbi:RiPP maturation radical SAM C-methyltransferase [Frankia sp. CcI49]|uniref:RiPP maturation radical SAM C-methyltransferase n=1 Tax=Frankia sp. CcI49 TaxID=1745382 RepID=UPI00097565D3|nr:RiPP maturation radical SAM C-methyltransferase [Frankia sp. CcI49]
MRTVLVHMPWAAVHVPSLALGILRTAAQRRGHEVTVRYANLDFADWVVGEIEFGRSELQFYTESSYFLGAGDWVFAGALHGMPADGESFARLLADAGASPARIELTRALHRIAPRFVDRVVADLLDLDPDVVGFTTTFQQNTASLAVARLLKERLPGVRIVFGGANCEGPQGVALHRAFGFVDFVVRGEGERTFPALLDAIDQGTVGSDRTEGLSDLPGLCWRAADGTPVANPATEIPLPPEEILPPTYDGFFERMGASVAASWHAPTLLVEGARGCWWGEKHHCTFCGLNGSLMQFRSKSPDAFLAELLDLARRHRVLDFVVVDNIIDMRYFDTVLRALAESDHDLRLHFEVKSNLRRHHFQALGDAGAAQVQPGIENLSSHVLRLMDKGVSGCQNVRSLRDAQSSGVSVSWNYLFGFPGELDGDYTSVLGQLPALHHLDPPAGSMRICIERFSPYFDRPELGFPDRRPAAQYREIYRLPDDDLADLAYLFTAPPRGIGADLAATLGAAVERWRAEHPHSRLTYHDFGDRIMLINSRPAYDWTVLDLTTPAELGLFRALDQPRGAAALARRLRIGPAAVAALLERWTDAGLVFHDEGKYVQLAVEAENQVLMRVRPGVVDETSAAARPAEPPGAERRDTARWEEDRRGAAAG